MPIDSPPPVQIGPLSYSAVHDFVEHKQSGMCADLSNHENVMADDHKSEMPAHNKSRRQFVKKAAYVAPLITSLAAAPAYVKAGSVKPDADWDAYRDKNGKDKDDKDDKLKDKNKNKD